jgi:hypothetical protein
LRTLHPDTLAAIKGDHLRAVLVTLNFVDPNGAAATVRLNNNTFDVQSNGQTFLGNGQLLTIGKIKQTIDIKISSLGLTLDAVDPALVAMLLGASQHGRAVSISLAILNPDYSIAGEIIPMNSMIIDGAPDIIDNPQKGQAVIKQKTSSEFANWKQKGGIRTTPASLQRFSPNDTGFDFAAESGKEYKWGAK